MPQPVPKAMSKAKAEKPRATTQAGPRSKTKPWKKRVAQPVPQEVESKGGQARLRSPTSLCVVFCLLLSYICVSR